MVNSFEGTEQSWVVSQYTASAFLVKPSEFIVLAPFI